MFEMNGLKFYQVSEMSEEIQQAFASEKVGDLGFDNDHVYFEEGGRKKFEEAFEFAKRTKQVSGLVKPFVGMSKWGSGNVDVVVYADWAPHSFFWNQFGQERDVPPVPLVERLPQWQKYRYMVGGVIYHGKLEDGSKKETFSVELTPSNSWSIHT